MKMAVFWVVVLCGVVEVYQHSEAACTAEMLANFHYITQLNNPEDNHLQRERIVQWKSWIRLHDI
jgi:hypothetical protein